MTKGSLTATTMTFPAEGSLLEEMYSGMCWAVQAGPFGWMSNVSCLRLRGDLASVRLIIDDWRLTERCWNTNDDSLARGQLLGEVDLGFGPVKELD